MSGVTRKGTSIAHRRKQMRPTTLNIVMDADIRVHSSTLADYLHSENLLVRSRWLWSSRA